MEKKLTVFDRCQHFDCENNTGNGSKLFRFPSPEDPRHKIWLECAGNHYLRTWAPLSIHKAGLCKEHFRPEDLYINVRGKLSIRKGTNPLPFRSNENTVEESTEKENGNKENVETETLTVLRKKNIKTYPSVNDLWMEQTDEDVYVEPPTEEVEMEVLTADPPVDGPGENKLPIERSPYIKRCEPLKSGVAENELSPIEHNPYVRRRSESSKNGLIENELEIEGSPYISREREERKNKRIQELAQQKALCCNPTCINPQVVVDLNKEIHKQEICIKKLKERMQCLQGIVKGKSKIIRIYEQKLLKRETKPASPKELEAFLDRHGCFNKAARAMVKLQLHKKKAPYDEDEKQWAMEMYKYSSSTYSRLRNAGLNLPSPSSIQRICTEPKTQSMDSEPVS